jgi:phospholipid/cholesterol/gamma-HCH transport system permease protein
MKSHYLLYELHQNYIKIRALGAWTLETTPVIEKKLKKMHTDRPLVWDLSGVEAFDSAGVLLFIEYLHHFQARVEVEVVGYTPNQYHIFQLLNQEYTPSKVTKVGFLERVGRVSYRFFVDMRSFSSFLGRVSTLLLSLLFRPKDLRIKEIIYHIHHSGFHAMLIVALTAFLVGMVIAYQGSVQLAKFGADIFIVDTVAISMTRELAPMVTAIVIAGRSGSAYTAEIGAMKLTEEISAMRTMGFDPYLFLVIPRIIALMISLPLLIFLADIVGIFGGMVASQMQLGISMHQFIDRLYEVLELKHYLLGLLKAPFFAIIIASIGAFRGFHVSNNTESIGHQTTASVVNGIFLVIACDALFSVIYTEFGL